MSTSAEQRDEAGFANKEWSRATGDMKDGIWIRVRWVPWRHDGTTNPTSLMWTERYRHNFPYIRYIKTKIIFFFKSWFMTKPSDVSMLQNRTWPFYVNFAPSWRKNIHVKHIKIVIFEIMEKNLTWSSRLVSQSYLQLSWPGFVRRQLLLLMPPFTEIKASWTVSELSLKSLKYGIANQLSGYEWYCVMLRQARVLTTNEQRTGEPNSTTTVYL